MSEKEIKKENNNIKENMNNNKEIVLYLIVNKDLKMSSGKIASQCSHAVCALVRDLEHKNNNNYQTWLANHEPIIVLKATHEEILDIFNKYKNIKDVMCSATYDAGRTQIDANSLTVIRFYPMARDKTPEIISQLKLL